MKNNNKSISIPHAQAHGVIDSKGYVSYNVLNKNGEVVGTASFPFCGTVVDTLANRCCFFGETPYISPEGIRVEMQSEHGHIAKLVIPAGKRLVYSAMNGAACIEEADTPFACSVASENYWCS